MNNIHTKDDSKPIDQFYWMRWNTDLSSIFYTEGHQREIKRLMVRLQRHRKDPLVCLYHRNEIENSISVVVDPIHKPSRFMDHLIYRLAKYDIENGNM